MRSLILLIAGILPALASTTCSGRLHEPCFAQGPDCCLAGGTCAISKQIPICSRCTRQAGQGCVDRRNTNYENNFQGLGCCDGNLECIDGRCGNGPETNEVQPGAATRPIARGPQTYNGIFYPDGDNAFATEIVDFAPGEGVGGPYQNPNMVVGPPHIIRYDWSNNQGANLPNLLFSSHVSLGRQGKLTVKFTKVLLGASGDETPDLHINEVGGLIEEMDLRIHRVRDNSWIQLGRIRPPGLNDNADSFRDTASIDIDVAPEVAFGDAFDMVELTDAGTNQYNSCNGQCGGADIESIGILFHFAPEQVAAPVEPEGWVMWPLLPLMFMPFVAAPLVHKRKKKPPAELHEVTEETVATPPAAVEKAPAKKEIPPEAPKARKQWEVVPAAYIGFGRGRMSVDYGDVAPESAPHEEVREQKAKEQTKKGDEGKKMQKKGGGKKTKTTTTTTTGGNDEYEAEETSMWQSLKMLLCCCCRKDEGVGVFSPTKVPEERKKWFWISAIATLLLNGLLLALIPQGEKDCFLCPAGHRESYTSRVLRGLFGWILIILAAVMIVLLFLWKIGKGPGFMKKRLG